VGTRADLEKAITAEKAQSMLRELQAAFFIETSAKTGMNVEQV